MTAKNIGVWKMAKRGEITGLKAGVIVNGMMAPPAQNHTVFLFIRSAGAFPKQIVGGFFRFDQRLAAMGAFPPLAKPGLGFGEVGKGHFVLLSSFNPKTLPVEAGPTGRN